jgi:hypothetical protein
MNKELVEAIRGGSTVVCAVITAATVSLDGAPSRPLDLSRKTSRQVVDNAATAVVIAEREADPVHCPVLMNRPGVGEAEWA